MYGSNSPQTSVIFTVSTQCCTKGPYKEGKLQTNPRCCFHCPTMLHPLLGGESVGLFNYTSSLPLKDQKNPSITTSPRLGSLLVIPLSTTPKANSTIAAQMKTEQDNPIFT
jgi:hypothetical protein